MLEMSPFLAVGVGMMILGLYHFCRATYYLGKIWRIYYGNWQSHQADDGGAKGHAVAAQHAGNASTVYPGGLTWVDPGKAAMGVGFGLGFGGVSIPPPPPPPFLGGEDTAHRCDRCGTVEADDAKTTHVCPVISQVDRDAVRTIQALAANGLSGEEIAADMGIVVGWRVWTPGHGLAGAGFGSGATWPLDAPAVAVCMNPSCSAIGIRDICARSPRPSCRVHAVKTRDQATYPGILGMVALWGEVIECEGGYLASRAYPLALASPAWARAYRVALLGDPTT